MNITAAIQDSVNYLSSTEAAARLAEDAYWPKWHAPWWHMLLLHELGETHQIPQATVTNYIQALNRLPFKKFPLTNADLPPGVDPFRGAACHCQLGCVYQVLAARGVNVDAELPWIRPWFLRYQMVDGGFNCDGEAYLVQSETPSSMVATIAIFEAVLLYTPRDWTSEENTFLDKAAGFLLDRKLMLGSSTHYNAAERSSAEKWSQLCFPRFYFYDVLRGLTAILKWSERCQRDIPRDALKDVVQLLKNNFSDDRVTLGRRAYSGQNTILAPQGAGPWVRGSATSFPLLDLTSEIGTESLVLSKQWKDAQQILRRLGFRGL